MPALAKRLGLLTILLLLLFLGVCASANALEYREYLRLHADTPQGGESIVLQAADYSAAEGEEISRLPDGTLSTGQRGYVEYRFSVPEDGLYTVTLRYFPGTGSGGDMLRALSINGETPFDEAGELSFSRLWNDQSRDYKNVSGNQPFPAQVQTPEWREAPCRDAQGYTAEPFRFFFPAGENTLRISSLQEGMLLSSITLAPPVSYPSYQEYLQSALANGAEYADIAPIKFQAEDAALKSSPSFYPINDRTSALSEPYHPSYIVLNCIGGESWNEPGEWIAWDLDVPETGLYRLVFRFKQSALRGLYATRSLSINGRIPFAEAADLRFYHGGGFQIAPLGAHRENPADTGEQTQDYWFYLEKGVNRICLEVTLGEMGAVLQDIDAATAGLNRLYRAIIAVTGTSPDIYQSYQLFTRIPQLRDSLLSYQEQLADILARLTALTGSGSERTAAITRMLAMMDSLTDSEEQLVRRLSAFKECITAMGKSVLDFMDQPLRIDYILLAGRELPALQAEGNFFQNLRHGFLSFIGSFTNDYNVADSALSDSQEVPVIDVWLSTGRDQFSVIRRLINESFETQAGVRVNLRLINADVLLPSTFTGRGPDVAIQIGNTAPVNFAFRGAAYDLKAFPDYAETAAQFLPAAMESFYYEGGCYALPDQMSFPVMFYRKDILSELSLLVPETWEDFIALIPELQRYNMELYLDTAPPSTLGAALSMGNSVPINTVFLSRLFQQGGELYSETGDRCLLSSEAGNAAFKWWTQFYTRHSFPREIDFVTRFRLGEVPIGVVDLSTYTRLAVSAPEIRGDWGVAPVPGSRDAEGNVIRAVPCVTGASMIVKSTVERKQTQNAAWSFLKWWTSGDTQTKYAQEMEAVLGQAGRYQVANLEAFDRIHWDLDVQRALQEMLPTLRGIPQVPGGYITGRYLNNAFVTVITNYENPSDTLFEYTQLIDEEIAAKRQEFGLDSAQ